MKQQTKTSQYIAISVSVIILVSVSIFLISLLTGSKNNNQNNNIEEQETPFDPKVKDNDTLQKIKKLNDYGVPEPDNLEKQDLFIPEISDNENNDPGI